MDGFHGVVTERRSEPWILLFLTACEEACSCERGTLAQPLDSAVPIDIAVQIGALSVTHVFG